MPEDAANEKLIEAIRVEAVHELASAARIVHHCLDQLDEAQTWWRPVESMNSVGNLVLHICGNVRQWIVSGVGGEPDHRRRQAEFDQREPLAQDVLRDLVNSTLEAARATLAEATVDDLLSQRVVQGFEVNGLRAVFHSMSHFRGHVQEIVHLTRAQLGDDYRFDFVPRGAGNSNSAER